MTVDEIYEAIAKEILNVINDDWDKACLEFEFVGEGVVGYTGDYVNDNNKKDMEVENTFYLPNPWLFYIFMVWKRHWKTYQRKIF